MGGSFLRVSFFELFKEDDDEAMYKNPYEIRLCDLISVSLEGRACSTAKRGQEIPVESLSGICLGVAFPS